MVDELMFPAKHASHQASFALPRPTCMTLSLLSVLLYERRYSGLLLTGKCPKSIRCRGPGYKCDDEVPASHKQGASRPRTRYVSKVRTTSLFAPSRENSTLHTDGIIMKTGTSSRLLALTSSLALAYAQFVPAPTDLIETKGFLDLPVRYKEVPEGICELTPGVKSYTGNEGALA